MKNISIFSITILVSLLWSCQQEVIDLKEPEIPLPPCNSCPEGAGSGSAAFDKFVTIGNSYVAGFQSGALFNEAQNNSLAKMISTQLACAGGSDVFNQPDISSVNGFNIQLSDVGAGIILGRMILFDDGSGADPVPVPAGTPGLPPPYNMADFPTPFIGDKSALNNFGVPFLYLGQALIADTGNPGSPLYNPLWARFASAPGGVSVLQDALTAAGSFYLIWLGMDDALLYAATGADGSYPLTSVENFNFQYNALISTMLNANPVFKGVVGNIPSLTSYPYFTTVRYNAIELNDTTAEQLQTSLANNYNSFVNAMVGNEVITEEEGMKRQLAYVKGNNGVLINDEDLTDLTQYMLDNGFAMLTPFAKARQATATDLIPLSAGAVLGKPYLNIPTAIQGVSWPVGDEHALTMNEIIEIETAIASFNAIIETAVAGSNDRLEVADVKQALQELLDESIDQGGLLEEGVALTSSVVPPTAAFSEDGLHPNDRGYAYIGNVFIEAINSKFGATVPRVCISEWGGTGLPISP